MERKLGFFYQIGQIPFSTFDQLARDIAAESTMLHPKPADLRCSFIQNLAAVKYDPETGKIIGFARFEALLNSETKKILQLPDDIPEIWELGTVYTSNNHRRNGAATEVQNKLLSQFLERISNQEILVILTAKPVAMIKTTQKASQLGIDFYACDPYEFEMIASLTCVCSGEFGQGFQNGNYCPARVSQNLRPVSENLDQVIKNAVDGIAACTMFVSNPNLSTYTNTRLSERFGSQKQLIENLINLNYYPQ